MVSEPSFSWNVTAMVSASDGAPCPCPCPIEGADPAAKPRARSSTAAHPRRGPASARDAEAAAPAETVGAAAPNVVTPHRAMWRTASRAPARSITSSPRSRATYSCALVDGVPSLHCFFSLRRCRGFYLVMQLDCSESPASQIRLREYLCSHFDDGRDEPAPPRAGWSPSCRPPCRLC